MTGSSHSFERVYALPPEIVWDALVDSDLVSGWLAEAEIEPREGGRYDLEWRHFDANLTTLGVIEELDEPHRLVVSTSNFGSATFTLVAIAEGARERSTLLRVDVAALADPEFSAPIAATWVVSLEQLDELLHGHPVDWSTWAAERQPDWDAVLAGAARPPRG